MASTKGAKTNKQTLEALSRGPLPRLVNAVGDRIGLNYRIDRKTATRKYIEQNQSSTRKDSSELQNTFYSLTESKTKKDEDRKASKKRHKLRETKNPLKLSSRNRKELYRTSIEEKQQLKYSTLERIHELWQIYSNNILKQGCIGNGKEAQLMAIFRLDLHGCKLRCVASKNPTLIGAEGIVYQETKNTFVIVKNTNKLLILPKRDSEFEFKIGDTDYRIHGCNLLFTTDSRSKVKYKRERFPLDI